jgi:hypothetical protein
LSLRSDYPRYIIVGKLATALSIGRILDRYKEKGKNRKANCSVEENPYYHLEGFILRSSAAAKLDTPTNGGPLRI